MSYKCPLCLAELTKDEKLARYCTEHPHIRGEFACSEEELHERMFCPGDNCDSAETVETGVFLRHLGCKARNPFWNEQSRKVAVPGEPHTTSAYFSLDFGSGKSQGVTVQHWMLGALRILPNDKPEMWFPLMLLRATAEKNGRRRVGKLIELAGARETGKTILAMQALDYQGYIPTICDNQHIELDNFIYSRRAEGSTDNSLLELIYLNTQLRLNASEIFLPQGTGKEPGNLKVVFLKPASASRLSPATANSTASKLKQPSNIHSAKSWIGHKLKSFITEIPVAIDEIMGSSGNRPFWYTVAFYDTAGEAIENEDLMLDLTAVDRVAVVINAAEIFGLSQGEKSIITAVSSIVRAKRRKKECDLVITQMDRAQDRLNEEDWKKVVRAATDMNLGAEGTDAITREMFTRWLRIKPNEIKTEMLNQLPYVQRIFFVWTENLPSSRQPAAQNKQPCSYGLAKFICRCLDTEWRDINHR